MEKLFAAVDKNRNLIFEAHDYIWKNPETGYKEWKTSAYLEEKFTALGYELIRAGDIPGFYTVLDTGIPGPEVLILGEMDSLICPNHKEADPNTGAVHACGHSAQSAALLGIAASLKEPGVLEGMCGRIRLCAVPAEELIEIGYRRQLKDKGIIKYFGGKPEFLRRGYFDGVDIAFMVHTSTALSANRGSVGCVAKNITYKGVSAHAGGSPWNGCNALYAATQGLSAANALRETFKESDYIRFHPIITHGGEAVNAIPEKVTIEAYVRGASFDAIRLANKRINRALCGGALSMGANIEIDDIPGYSPLRNDMNLHKLMMETAKKAYPDVEFFDNPAISTGSTDMGDISSVIPALHPYAPGARGTSHGADYIIADVEKACVSCAKWQLATLYRLLCDNASYAQKVIDEFEPTFASKQEFFDYLDTLWASGERISYCEDKAEIKL